MYMRKIDQYLKEIIEDIHSRKPSYGYRRINAKILQETGWKVSDNLVHKVCKLNNIKSKARHYKYKKPGEESIKYESLIKGNWKTSRPFEKLCQIQLKYGLKENLMIGHSTQIYIITKLLDMM